MNMKYEPVKIYIEDNKKYTDVALIVDRDDFLEQIDIVRRILGITLPLPDNKQFFRRWLELKQAELPKGEKLEVIKNLLNRFYKSEDGAKILERIIAQRKKEGSNIALSNILFLATTHLLSNFKLSANYSKAIEKLIISNVIDDYDFSSVIGCIFSPFWFLPKANRTIPIDKRINLPIRDGIMFYFYPHTTRKELHNAIDKNYDKLVAEYNEWFGKKDYNLDTISNIKRDRDWYWQKKQGKTYLQIAEEDKVNKIDPEDFKETVRKAIKRYEKDLNSPI